MDLPLFTQSKLVTSRDIILLTRLEDSFLGFPIRSTFGRRSTVLQEFCSCFAWARWDKPVAEPYSTVSVRVWNSLTPADLLKSTLFKGLEPLKPILYVHVEYRHHHIAYSSHSNSEQRWSLSTSIWMVLSSFSTVSWRSHLLLIFANGIQLLRDKS